jgi:hypothetical protein
VKACSDEVEVVSLDPDPMWPYLAVPAGIAGIGFCVWLAWGFWPW